MKREFYFTLVLTLFAILLTKCIAKFKERQVGLESEKNLIDNEIGWENHFSVGWGQPQINEENHLEEISLLLKLLEVGAIAKRVKAVSLSIFAPLVPIALLSLGFFLPLISLLSTIIVYLLSTSTTTAASMMSTTTATPVTTTPGPSTVMFYAETNYGSFSGSAELPFGVCVVSPPGLAFSSIRTGGACLALYQSNNCAPANSYLFVPGDVPELGVFDGSVTQSLMVINCP